MMYKTIQKFLVVASLAVMLPGCASAPKKSSKPKKVAQQEAPLVESLPKRVLKGAGKTTINAAMGAAKGAATLTLDSAQLAAKGAALGMKASGDAVVGTGKIVAKGTRKTARGLGDGLEYIFKAPAVKDAASPVGNKTLMDAALSPLSDFNIRKRERPEVLMRLESETLYYVEAGAGCEWLTVRIAELDEALGADYDAKENSSSVLEKVGKTGKGAMISSVASAAGTHIPGRSLLRSMSGAKARQKQTREIYQKGIARRSYLKGIVASQNCESYNEGISDH